MSALLVWLPPLVALLAVLDLLRVVRRADADRVRVLLDAAVTLVVLVAVRQVTSWAQLGRWGWFVVVAVAAVVAALAVRRAVSLPWLADTERHPRRRVAVSAAGVGVCAVVAGVLVS